MKNVQNVTSKANSQPSSAPAANLEWTEEWVPLSKVIKHAPLQPRQRLDDKAVRLYANMTKEGSIPPPIKVARVNGLLYLLDGWHRMEAGALQTDDSFEADERTVLALVASMPFESMYWAAAQCNVFNGVRYKPADHRHVFSAFIKSKRHHKGRKVYMGYREMAQVLGLGISYSTLRRWVQADFPALFAALADKEGAPEGGLRDVPIVTQEEQHSAEARKAAASLSQHAGALSDPVNRWDVLKQLEATAAMLRAKGVEEPQF